MTNICLINSYNHSKYLKECLDSALSQSLPFDRIIVIDDGSIDDSQNIIRDYQKQYSSQLHAICKKNRGQLSVFNAATDLIKENDQVFLLDCDDFYPHDYHELIHTILKSPWDISFCEIKKFKDKGDLLTAKINNKSPESISKSSALIRKQYTWLGSPTSAISISGGLFREILPYPNEEDFKIRADDVLVYASSILGAKKYFLPSLCVGWREHSRNNTLTYSKKTRQDNQRLAAVERLFAYYCNRSGLPLRSTIFEAIEEINLLPAKEKKYALFRLGFLFNKPN